MMKTSGTALEGKYPPARLYGQGRKNYPSDRSTKHPDPGPENGQTAALHAY